jgi:hypothetical protein
METATKNYIKLIKGSGIKKTLRTNINSNTITERATGLVAVGICPGRVTRALLVEVLAHHCSVPPDVRHTTQAPTLGCAHHATGSPL